MLHQRWMLFLLTGFQFGCGSVGKGGVSGGGVDCDGRGGDVGCLRGWGEGCGGGAGATSWAPNGMVEVPAGEFVMGCGDGVLAAGLDRAVWEVCAPEHVVYLERFWIDKFEVTAGEFADCIGAGACSGQGECITYGGVANIAYEVRSEYPMNCVSWSGAAEYCAWVGRRLCREAEWEKAARGADGWLFPWGSEPLPDCCLTVMGAQGEATEGGDCECGLFDSQPIGSRLADSSVYGTRDMCGNVSEWVADWYDWAYWKTAVPANPSGPSSGVERVRRGGNFTFYNPYMPLCLRLHNDPAWVNSEVGFRCCL